MGIVELVLLTGGSFIAGAVVLVLVVANNKPLARKLLDS